jgi:hypothetical protein
VTLKGGDRPNDSADSGGDGIEVSSDLEVRLNGETIFEDDNDTPQFAPASMVVGAGPPIDPIEFRAKPGDRLQIIATTGTTGNQYLDPLFLACPGQPDQQLTEGVGDAAPGPNVEFFNEEFVIGSR